MELPIQISASQYAYEILDLYQHYVRHRNFGKQKYTEYFNILSNGYKCLEYYRKDDICAVEDSVMFIDSLKEGWHVLYRSDEWPKDKHYFILSSADWDSKDPYFGLKINYTLLYFPYFLFETVRTFTSFKHELFFANVTYNFEYPKQLNFCSFSASVKPHRDYLINKILPQCNPNRYAVKYAGQNFGVDIEHLDIVQTIDTPDTDHYHTQANKMFESTLGKELRVESSQHMPIDIFNISYYTIIVESIYIGNVFFPTEKIFKALIAGIPFVCIATQNFLQGVRDLGFRTYNELWDESYDTIEDDEHRFKSIGELVIQLENFDWTANRDKLIEIANHNKLQMTHTSEIFADCFRKMEYEIEQYRNSNI